MPEIYQVMEEPAYLPPGTLLQLSDTQQAHQGWRVQGLATGWWLALVPLWFRLGEVVTLAAPMEATFAGPFTPPELKEPVMYSPNQHLQKKKALAAW